MAFVLGTGAIHCEYRQTREILSTSISGGEMRQGAIMASRQWALVKTKQGKGELKPMV